MKTTQKILDEWDDYKNNHIDSNKDWSIEHDNYLNKKWYTKEELIRAFIMGKNDSWMSNLKEVFDF